MGFVGPGYRLQRKCVDTGRCGRREVYAVRTIFFRVRCSVLKYNISSLETTENSNNHPCDPLETNVIGPLRGNFTDERQPFDVHYSTAVTWKGTGNTYLCFQLDCLFCFFLRDCHRSFCCPVYSGVLINLISEWAIP